MTTGEIALLFFALSLIPLGWITVEDLRYGRRKRDDFFREQLQQISWALVAHSPESKRIIDGFIKPMKDRLDKGQ